MSDDNIHAAKAGDWYLIPTMTRISEPCENKTGGFWRCVTHEKTFETQLNKDFHIHDDSDHTLVWMCIEHGPEAP